MYFHVGEDQAYVLTGAEGDEVFGHVEAAGLSDTPTGAGKP
jgi:carbonic anhydrase